MESSIRTQLQEAGLTADQAAVYHTLLKTGPMNARKVALEAGVSRTLTYAVLDQLIAMGLVAKHDEKNAVSQFAPLHPNALEERVRTVQKNAERSASALQEALPTLASAFNLSIGRPGIRFYEGKDGIKEVLNDSLTSKTEIRAYVDNESIRQYIPDLNESYVKSRSRLNIKRLNIATDTQENRFAIEGFLPKLTEWRLVPWEASPINTIVQIYDGKISYFTLGSEHLIGIIITDPHIYEFHRRQFNYLWNSPAVYAWPEETKNHERERSRLA